SGLTGQCSLALAFHHAQMLDLGADRAQQLVALRELPFDRVLLGEALRDDLLLFGLCVREPGLFPSDGTAERLHVADDRAALVVHTIDGVEAVQEIVETRRAENNLESRVRIARRVVLDRLTCKRGLRVLQVHTCDAELETRALEVVADTRKLHVRQVPALDRGRELCLDRADLRDDALCFCFLRSDWSGIRGRCRGDSEGHCYDADNSGYVTDSRPNNGNSPSGGKPLRPLSPGTSQARQANRLVGRSQTENKPKKCAKFQCGAVTNRVALNGFCGTVPRSCGGFPDSGSACS